LLQLRSTSEIEINIATSKIEKYFHQNNSKAWHQLATNQIGCAVNRSKVALYNEK